MRPNEHTVDELVQQMTVAINNCLKIILNFVGFYVVSSPSGLLSLIWVSLVGLTFFFTLPGFYLTFFNTLVRLIYLSVCLFICLFIHNVSFIFFSLFFFLYTSFELVFVCLLLCKFREVWVFSFLIVTFGHLFFSM